MSQDSSDRPAGQFRRDRREHGGSPERLDDDQLARLTEEERVEAGIDAYDPEEVPPAAGEPAEPDVTETEEYQQARAEIRRESSQDELVVEHERDPYPPTHYDR